MNADSALEAFASISVGIAGFSAIVVALSANTVLYDGRRLSWALGIIFGWSLGAMLFSILPYIFHFFAMTEPLIWQVGLLVMGGFVGVVGTVISYRDHRLNHIGLDIRGRGHDSSIKRSIEMTIAIILYIMAFMMLIAAGIWQPIPGYYLVGMTIMLMLSLWVLLYVFFIIGFSKKRKGG
jgi:hypothetical protein